MFGCCYLLFQGLCIIFVGTQTFVAIDRRQNQVSRGTVPTLNKCLGCSYLVSVSIESRRSSFAWRPMTTTSGNSAIADEMKVFSMEEKVALLSYLLRVRKQVPAIRWHIYYRCTLSLRCTPVLFRTAHIRCLHACASTDTISITVPYCKNSKHRTPREHSTGERSEIWSSGCWRSTSRPLCI